METSNKGFAFCPKCKTKTLFNKEKETEFILAIKCSKCGISKIYELE